jgi:iron(III) transport system permease protein
LAAGVPVIRPAACVALFIAYPIVELLARRVVPTAASIAPLASVLGSPYNRQAVCNTLLLGADGRDARDDSRDAVRYAMTRVEMPGKRVWHFLALLPTISPPILMALSLILLYGRRGL